MLVTTRNIDSNWINSIFSQCTNFTFIQETSSFNLSTIFISRIFTNIALQSSSKFYLQMTQLVLSSSCLMFSLNTNIFLWHSLTFVFYLYFYSYLDYPISCVTSLSNTIRMTCDEKTTLKRAALKQARF